MPMVPFYSKFPDLAFKETRPIIVRGRDDLPNGEYGFIELYCDERDCDCRRVMINVVAPTTGPKIWATINYGWEKLEFYAKWMRDKETAIGCEGPSLDPLNPRTAYSRALLPMFEFVLKDEAYVERLKRHYELFKSAIKEEDRPRRLGRHLGIPVRSDAVTRLRTSPNSRTFTTTMPGSVSLRTLTTSMPL